MQDDERRHGGRSEAGVPLHRSFDGPTEQAATVGRWIAAVDAIAATLPAPGPGRCDDRVMCAAWLLGAHPSCGFDPGQAVYVASGNQARPPSPASSWDAEPGRAITVPPGGRSSS